MPEQDQKPEVKIDTKPPDPPKLRPRRKRRINLDDSQKADVAGWILETHRRERDNRQELIRRRNERRLKLMGWLPDKDWPWSNAANFWLPIMLIADSKMKATLENALKSMRPMMRSKARQRRNIPKQEAIDNVQDFQFYMENAGEKVIQDAVSNFVEDEAAYLFAQWVKETQTIHDVRVLPGIDPSIDHIPQLLESIPELFPSRISESMQDDEGWVWEIVFEEQQERRTARVEFFESDDGKLEAHIAMKAITHDGPCITVEDFEDIVFPVRSANLQPPGPANPRGAPWVDRIFSISPDTIRRRMKDGTYNLIDQEEFDTKILGSKPDAGSGSQTDEVQEQKDFQEGSDTTFGAGNREELQGIMRFGRLDVNNDGLEEDVIIWILEESQVLMKIELLTAIYPGVPIKRPFAHESFVPISNRVLGLSQSTLLEAFQDMMQIMIDQHVDAGTITNTPFGFYRAASGLKAEPISLEPGVMIPLDDPARDVNFPQFPQRDSTFAVNMITLLQQYVERVQMFSDTSLGRVPTGKASALRTLGTTMSLLAQGDIRPEQVLRRVFSMFSETFSMMHRLNRRYLPAEKEIRVVGKSPEGEDAYLTVKHDDMDADVDFEFLATMLNTNKQVLQANLDKIIMLAFTPVAFQAGLIDQDKMYNILRDQTKALDLDPDRYWNRPPQMLQGPELLAEEVISAILANEIPQGKPLETPQEHLQKLGAFMQSDELGFMNQTQVAILKEWIAKIQAFVNQQMMMQQALAQFQQGAQGNGGPGGVETTFQEPGIGDNPNVNANESIDESVSGNGAQ